MAIKDRVGSNNTIVLAKIAAIEEATLARQLVNVDAMIADPLAKITEWQVDVLANHSEVLVSRAGATMTGIERAAAITGPSCREGHEILRPAVADCPIRMRQGTVLKNINNNWGR